MDIFSRVLYAPRVDLTIAVTGTLVSAVIGGAIGAVVGYYEGQRAWRRALSTFVMRSADVLQAFPVFVFAIALVAVFGQSVKSIVIAIAFVNVPIYLRLMRSQVLSIRQLRYVEAAYVAGASDLAILWRHVIPNALAPLVAQLSINIGWSVLLTAGLSFVGAGVVAPTPEWGSMIAMGFQNIVTGQWWPSVFPGIALGLTVFGFALVGASIEVLADPARRRVLSGIARLIMLLLRYIARRVVFVVPQLFGIVLVSFFLVKLIPGDPAVMMLGPTASAQSLAELRDQHGLHQAPAAAIHPLRDGRGARRSRHVVADHPAGHRGSLPALSRHPGADHLRPAAGRCHRLSAGRRRGAAEARPGPQVRRLLRAAGRGHAGLLAGAGADLHLLHRAGLDSGAARPHRHGGAAAAHDHRQPGDRQPARRRLGRAALVARAPRAAGPDARASSMPGRS